MIIWIKTKTKNNCIFILAHMVVSSKHAEKTIAKNYQKLLFKLL